MLSDKCWVMNNMHIMMLLFITKFQIKRNIFGFPSEPQKGKKEKEKRNTKVFTTSHKCTKFYSAGHFWHP